MRQFRTGAGLAMSALFLAACTQMTTLTQRPATEPTAAETPPPAEIAAVTRAPAPRPAARATAAQLDTTTAEQRAAAARPAIQAETRLGTTVASLGDPTQPGFWIKTPLVSQKGVGRLVNPATGKSAQVELIPLPGPATGGSQVSLPALQLLGVSLTDLPVLEVYRS